MYNNLIKRRIELGIKRNDIAKILGYSLSHYSNIENGIKALHIRELYKLSYILDVNDMYIAGLIDEPIPLNKYKRECIKKHYNLDDNTIKKLYGKDVYDITK